MTILLTGLLIAGIFIFLISVKCLLGYRYKTPSKYIEIV